MGMDSYIMHDDGSVEKVEDILKWATSFEVQERKIGHTLFDGKLVSTVFLGIDHNFGGGEPLLFETMVFDNNEGNELYCERYSTYEEAKAGHQKIVDSLDTILKDTEEDANLQSGAGK